MDAGRKDRLMTQSEHLFKRAKQFIPGGVNSPVRAYQSVGGTPPFIAKAEGATLIDEDGNHYLDYVNSWGPILLGHNHPEIIGAVTQAVQKGLSFGAATRAEAEMAELMCSLVPSLEMVRMVNSGTEAVMSAIRAARGYTGRDKIIKFEGCYHGHSDGLLVKAGSGLMTQGVPSSAGVPQGCTLDTLTASYNDLHSVRQLLERYPNQVAAVIVEPVAANMGVVEPAEGFLSGLRNLCDRYGTVLIFDEVITGFRLGIDGAQGYYGVQPDLTTFGKVIGAGMPVGAYGGKREIMQMVSPCGPVYQAGTLSGNPVAMAAGLCQLTLLHDHPEIYDAINRLGKLLRQGLRDIITRAKAPCCVTGVGSLCCLFFTPGPVTDYSCAQRCDTGEFGRYFHHMLSGGYYLAPSQFEAMFLSFSHTEQMIRDTLSHAAEFFLRGDQ
jgi:glutamate-1-semialdehyde 2,1-aminomutase